LTSEQSQKIASGTYIQSRIQAIEQLAEVARTHRLEEVTQSFFVIEPMANNTIICGYGVIDLVIIVHYLSNLHNLFNLFVNLPWLLFKNKRKYRKTKNFYEDNLSYCFAAKATYLFTFFN